MLLFRVATLSALVFLTSLTSPTGALAQQDPVVEWIRANAVPLTTVEAGHGFADMEPIRKIVGNARIVALGEATHGTREFFQFKHRMLEFLASEMGFTIFSIEANMPEAYRLNDYVLTGRGDPAELLRGMYFWTWNTEEVLEMIRWMRQFNASGKGRVQFTGFDMQTPTVAAQIVRDHVAKTEPDYEATVREATTIAAAARSTAPNAPAFGVATATFPVKDAAGKRIRYSGYIKTEGITNGYAGLWWRVDGEPGVTLAFDNMQARNIRGTTDWTRYVIDLPVDAAARNINFGMLHPGDGAAWFAGLAIELDGQPYRPTTFDMDLAAGPLRGFSMGGNGYDVQRDTVVLQDGKPSLRIRQIGAPAPTPAAAPQVTAQFAATKWQEIVAHLQSVSGVRTAEADWAIQNARVVLQGLQMNANQVSRDRSMADNVKWILDQNPKAKIVLWAHNGHIALASPGRPGAYEPMGASLMSMYGSEEMVVFGFAFNQGSFQAIETGATTGLRNFTVPPADSGSFDATLAAARIPVFALDMRTASRDGPVGSWLLQSHKSRWIGSVYSEANPAPYFVDLMAPRHFDAVFFVETTTAARKNPPPPAR